MELASYSTKKVDEFICVPGAGHRNYGETRMDVTNEHRIWGSCHQQVEGDMNMSYSLPLPIVSYVLNLRHSSM